MEWNSIPNSASQHPKRFSLHNNQIRSLLENNIYPTIKTKSWTQTILFAWGMGAVLALLLYWGGLTYFTTEFKKDHMFQTQLWATRIETLLSQQDTTQIREMTRQWHQERDIEAVWLLDRNGTIWNQDDTAFQLDPQLRNHAVGLSRVYWTERVDENRGKRFAALHPLYAADGDSTVYPSGQIPDDDHRLGTFIAMVNSERLFKTIQKWIPVAIAMGFLPMLVFAGWMTIVIKNISDPIHRLRQTTSKLAAGQLVYPEKEDLRRRDEVGSMARSLSQVTDSLRESKDNLRTYALSLEKRINEGTLRLKESEQKYRMLFKYAGTAFTLIDRNETLTMVNKQFEHLSGFAREDLEGLKKFTDFFTPPDRDRLKSVLEYSQDSFSEHKPRNFECTFLDREGSKKDVNLVLNPILNSTNTLASLADVTEIRDLQKRLSRTEHLAAIGELAAAIAHEIRNPLGAINTSVEVLQNGLDLEEENRELMEIICEETKRLDSIISDFLQFARLNKSQLKKVNINRLLSETLVLFKGTLQNSIHKKIDLEDGLPEIAADPNQLKQVIINIVVNALEAMPSGGELYIGTKSIHNQSKLDIHIIIKDSGEGMDPTHIPKIFQPFFSTKEKGIGMGLAICDRIIQNHGGEIIVNTDPGAGTTFTLVLPEHAYVGE